MSAMEDDLDIHEVPGGKQLSPEAKLISNLMEKCISRVEIAAVLPAILQLNSESGVGHERLSRSLHQHQLLEKRLEALAVKEESHGEREGEDGKVGRRALTRLEKDIKDSLRDLLRLSRDHPEAITGLRADLGTEVGESESALIQVLKTFHSHMLEELLISVEEEQQLALRKPVSFSPPNKLEDLASAEEEKVKTLSELDSEISQIEADIERMNRKDLREAHALVVADKQRQSLIKTSMMKQSTIQQNIDQLNAQLNNLILGHRQTERAIQQKNKEMEMEIEHLLQIFDDKIGDQQVKLELDETAYAKEEEQLARLGKPFSVLEVEANKILEKQRLAEEKRKEEMRELELKTKAAIIAQAWWRGYTTRRALENRSKSKSKKGKKSKGKKTK